MAEPRGDRLQSDQQKPNVGFGIFLLLAGVAILAQQLGWIPSGFDWFFPTLLIVWGASEVFRRFR